MNYSVNFFILSKVKLGNLTEWCDGGLNHYVFMRNVKDTARLVDDLEMNKARTWLG